MHHDRTDLGRVEVSGPSIDLGVAEAVVGEPGFPGLGGGAGEPVVVGGDGDPEGPGAELTVLQHFGMPERDLVPGRPGDGDLEPADEVLPEIEDQGPGRGGDHLGDGAFLDPANRFGDSRLRGGGDGCRDSGRHPAGGVEVGS